MTLFWFLCAVLPPIFWALSNIFDQYVTRYYCEGSPTTFVAIAGVASFPVAVFCLSFIWHDVNLFSTPTIFWSMLTALCFSVALFPYFYALSIEDAHSMTPLIQTNIFMVAVLAWVILGEHLTASQMIGGLIVFAATIASTKPTGIAKWPKRAIILIFTATFFWSLFNFFLRLIDPAVSTWIVTFWICMTWSILTLILCLSRSNRQILWAVLCRDQGRAFGLNFIQQLGDIGASAARAAALAIPIVPAAVTVVIGGGLHPFFALIFGALAARLIPSLYTFTLTCREILYKIACFAVMMGGLALVVGV